MLTKAYVVKVIDSNNATVRVPIYDKISGTSGATADADLKVASICTPPGVKMALKPGDIVFVDFELDLRSNPVIMGMLSRDGTYSSCNIDAQSVKVNVDVQLPEEAIDIMSIKEGGGAIYTPGAAIDITGNTISVKYDDDTIKVNSAGQLIAPSGGSGSAYFAGEGLNLDTATHTFSADYTYVQPTLTEGTGIDIDSTHTISVDTNTIQEKMSAGTAIDITSNAISAKYDDSSIKVNASGQLYAVDTSKTYQAGTGLNLDTSTNTFSADFNTVQSKLIAGSNIAITGTTISATDTTYSAGNGIDISGTTVAAKTDNDTIKVNASGQLYADVQGTTYYAGSGLNLDTATHTFSADYTAVQGKMTAGSNITISADNKISATDTTYSAGNNIQINGTTISATDTTYSAGSGIDITGTTISADTTVLQEKLTAGTNISITGTTISATDTTYSAGSGINITGNAISVDTTTIQPKLTAGTNISFNGNTISAVDTTYTAGNNVQIDGTVISATDTTYTAGSNIQITGTTISATDTTYIAGTGIDITGNVISCTVTPGGTSWGSITGTLSNQTDLQAALDAKQATLTAGDNITITGTTISATDTTYSNGTGISITNNAIAVEYDGTSIKINGSGQIYADVDNTLSTITNSQIDALFT